MNEVKEIVISLCEIILTDKDSLNKYEGILYVKKLDKSDFELIESIKEDSDNSIHNLLFYLVSEYIHTYQYSTDTRKCETLFAFYGEGSFELFRSEFKKTYLEIRGKDFPFLFNCIFDYIQEMSEHYRIFQKFYSVSNKETISSILDNVETTAENASRKAINKTIATAVTSATKNIKEIVEQQTEEAKLQAIIAKNEAQKARNEASSAAEDAAELAVNKKMIEFTSKSSENNVTILGIFSSIVLTVVAGLFYSSSVLESVNSANFFRLICIVSFVGLVCYHLIALMFKFIEKIKDSKKSVVDFNKRDWIITIILVIFITLGIILQFVFPPQETTIPDITNVYGQISVDMIENSNTISNNAVEENTATSNEEITESNSTNNQ